MIASRLALCATLAALGAPAQAFTLNVIHLNDMHSRVESVGETGSTCKAEDEAAGKCLGGAARVKTAIAAAKAEIPPIHKNRKVDFTTAKGRTHYTHEDMAEVARTVDPILSRYGLSYRFRTSQDNRILTVTCILSHRDGYSEETTLNGAADESGNKNHIQAIGSAATYLQRYTLKLALGLAASDDDDGRTAEKVETISADQFFAMQGLIESTATDPVKFAQYLKVENLETLTLKQFDIAMSALRHKQKQQGAK